MGALSQKLPVCLAGCLIIPIRTGSCTVNCTVPLEVLARVQLYSTGDLLRLTSSSTQAHTSATTAM